MCFNYDNVKQYDFYKFKCGSNKCKKTAYDNFSVKIVNAGLKYYSQKKNPVTLAANFLEKGLCECADKTKPPSLFCCFDLSCSKIACETFQDCPQSINVKGNYLVGIYLDKDGDSQCQTFTKDVVNLGTEAITSSPITGIHIIPIK